MNKKSKFILIALCAVFLVAASVLGTIAFFTDEESVVNTFTVGKVDIILDEAVVTADGKPVDPAKRTEQGNAYHLIPGQTYVKDPTITVKANSEPAYIRMMVTVDKYNEWKAILGEKDLTTIFNGYNENVWTADGKTVDTAKNTVTYEFRYNALTEKPAADQKLPALFTSFTVPGEITKEQLASVNGFNITVTGHAIQMSGFNNANAAWATFDEQVNP